MKTQFFIIIMCMLSMCSYSNEQLILKDYNASDFKFVGYKKGIPIYYCKSGAGMEYSKYSHSFWNAKLNSDKTIELLLVELISKDKGNVIYVNDKIIVYYSFIGNGEYEFIIEYGNIELIRFTSKLTKFYFTYNEEINTLYFSVKKYTEPQLSMVNLNKSPLIIEILPVFGSHPVINDQYLYFSSTLISNSFSSLPYDLFRVKVSDWNTTELIYENIENEDWIALPNGMIFLHTYLKDNRNKDIVLNSFNMKYDLINSVKFKNVIKYNSELYIEQKVLKSNSNHKVYTYEYIDTTIFKFSNEIIKYDLKREIILNIHYKEKPFINTFITEELLYNSTSQDLLELTKEDLRILRNAFYARQGYTFKSKDLQEFFGQFEWYHKMVERNKYLEITNDEVVISPKDKERVELILEIENNKK